MTFDIDFGVISSEDRVQTRLLIELYDPDDLENSVKIINSYHSIWL